MATDNDIFRIKHNDLLPSKGRILISEPFLQEAYFQRSVVLIVEHDMNGSMGFILNKRTNLIVNDYFDELKDCPAIPIYLGGPVCSNRLFFIHTLGDRMIPSGLSIDENISFDGDFGQLIQYIKAGNPIEEKIKFFLGYSGWTPNQLQEEISRDSWLVGQEAHKHIMLADDDTYWNRAIEGLGSPYKTWSIFPKNPDMN